MVILNRIIRHETVGLETILGAICVYVLIGIAFAGIYGAVNETEPAGFFAQHDRTRTTSTSSTSRS